MSDHDRPRCIECLKAASVLPDKDKQPIPDAVAVVPTHRPNGGVHWILMCAGCMDDMEDEGLPESVYLEADSYDREDDPEEVKREAETTPCPMCGKLPEVQQHVDGLGVRHQCNENMWEDPEDSDIEFVGYASDWIEEVKQIKKKAEETVCPQCEKPPIVGRDGRLGCEPGVCSNATGSYSYGGWLDYCKKNADWWERHPVEADIRERGNQFHQKLSNGIADLQKRLNGIPDGND